MADKIYLLCLLIFTSIEDIRKKKVNVWLLLASGSVAFLFQLCYKKQNIAELLCGVLVGVGLLFYSWITKGKVGTGDAGMLIVTGLFLGGGSNLLIFFMGTMLAGIYGAMMLFRKRKKKEDEIAFLPFLLLAYLLMICFEMEGFG